MVGFPYFLFVILSSLRGTLTSNGEDRNSVCPGASNGGLVIFVIFLRYRNWSLLYARRYSNEEDH